MENGKIRKDQHQEDIQRLKDWMQKQPYMPKKFDDRLLESFVTGTKSMEICKRKLDSFCAMRTKFPQYFSFPLRDPLDPGFKENNKSSKMFMLPKSTPEGYRVFMSVHTDPRKFDCVRYILKIAMMTEIDMVIDPNSKGGICVICFSSSDSTLLSKVNLPASIFMNQYVQSSIPRKTKLVCLCNAPSVIDRFMVTFIKPYIKKKLYDRWVITSEGIDFLKARIPVEMLPSDFGGEEPSCDELDAQWTKILEDKRDWFLETAEMRTDETKRPPDETHTFGVEGTFRTLSVD